MAELKEGAGISGGRRRQGATMKMEFLERREILTLNLPDSADHGRVRGK